MKTIKPFITISIVIPVYNESLRLYKTFHALETLCLPSVLKLEEIIFVDDGSTDNSKVNIQKVCRSSAKAKGQIEQKTKAKVTLISYPVNKGKGYAVRQGMLASKSEYTIFFDADISTPLFELNKFLPAMKKNTPVIIGTRKNGTSTVVVHQPLYRELLGHVFTLLSKIILNTWVTDFTCGFKAISKPAKNAIFPQTVIDRWGYDAEICFLAKKLKFTVQEIPVVWSNDAASRVQIINDSLRTFLELIQIRSNDIKKSFALPILLRTLFAW